METDQPHCLQGALALGLVETLTYLGASLTEVPGNMLWDFMKLEE